MPTIAIEIHDAGLNAAADGISAGTPSPGYALLERRQLVTGEEARGAARLKPRHISHSHWDHLDRQAVGRPFPRGLNRADLVHAHLSHYWSGLMATLGISLAQTTVVLAVPSSYSVDQLSLLLGIARACEIPVTGLVDAALAGFTSPASQVPTPAGRLLHLDLRLQRAEWTSIESGERLRRGEVESVPSGLLRLQQTWARHIADRFVRETRFDPLHQGASEQALYDRLPDWLAELRHRASVVATLEGSGQERSVEISASDLAAAARAELAAIADAAARLRPESLDGLVVSARAASIPGLAECLDEALGITPIALSEGASAAGALRHRAAIEAPGREVPLVVELPRPSVPPHGATDG